MAEDHQHMEKFVILNYGAHAGSLGGAPFFPRGCQRLFRQARAFRSGAPTRSGL